MENKDKGEKTKYLIYFDGKNDLGDFLKITKKYSPDANLKDVIKDLSDEISLYNQVKSTLETIK